MLIHDGILFEETDPEKIAHAIEIMRQAGRDVCGGFEVGVDLGKRIEGGEHYHDTRKIAVKMYTTIENTIEAIAAMPKRRKIG